MRKVILAVSALLLASPATHRSGVLWSLIWPKGFRMTTARRGAKGSLALFIVASSTGLLPVSANPSEGPGLDETVDFIVDNSGYENPPYGVYQKIVSVSCEGVVFATDQAYKDGARLRKTEVTWVPRDVTYKERSGRDYSGEEMAGGEVIVTCSTGQCIRVTNYEYYYTARTGQTDSRRNSIELDSLVLASRLQRALVHHQTLCGGPRQSPF